ncbi:hypothetical protein [Methylotenera sp.]|uniref:hypothetical protein n=1 Tax=Methylotenera sp. TaxID=2051956 RepID=UPI002EDBA4AB
MSTPYDVVPGNNKRTLNTSKGDTYDIIQVILDADPFGPQYVENLAQQLKADTVYETCYNIYRYVHDTIPYQEDKNGYQFIQLPGALYNGRHKHLGGTGKGGDCKSMALFASSVLRALGNYNFVYRFIAEKHGQDLHHVYIVAYDENGLPITIDSTLSTFDDEAKYAYNEDYEPTKPHKVSGKIAGIGRIGLQTQADAGNDFWEQYHDWMKNNTGTLIANMGTRLLSGVLFANGCKLNGKGKFVCDPPSMDNIKNISIAKKIFLKDKDGLYTAIIKMGSCLIYKYWNDPSFYAYVACRQGSQDTTPRPLAFPADILAKKDNSDEIYNMLHGIGCRDADIKELCNVSTYLNYGVSLDYMLYRCYCVGLYGQEFAPKPGIPYYNKFTDGITPNGATFQMGVELLLNFPAQGGMGRPNGTPYWTRGGWVSTNGASELEVKKWLEQPVNARPGTLTTSGQTVPGTILPPPNTPQEEAARKVAMEKSMKVYNDWRKGEMVVIPNQGQYLGQGKIGVQGAAIGLGAAEIASIVIAVAAAISAIVVAVLKYLESVKIDSKYSTIPDPPSDFQFEYNTADGCMIGTSVSQGGNVKICNGQITEVNPDLNDPANQPPDPGNGFIDKILGGGNALKVGGALLLGGGLLLLSSSSSKTKS